MSVIDWANVAVRLWWVWLALAVVIGADVAYARGERRSGE